jgi:BCD family chlorophyll transporter-like MFS transporter
MANALSRLIGSVLGGAVRDLVARLTQQPVTSYVVVFGIMALIMLISLVMLRRINVKAFQQQAEAGLTLVERAAMAGDPG